MALYRTLSPKKIRSKYKLCKQHSKFNFDIIKKEQEVERRKSFFFCEKEGRIKKA